MSFLFFFSIQHSLKIQSRKKVWFYILFWPPHTGSRQCKSEINIYVHVYTYIYVCTYLIYTTLEIFIFPSEAFNTLCLISAGWKWTVHH